MASALAEELALYLRDPDRLLVFPESDAFPYERVATDLEAAMERLTVLRRLEAGEGPPPIVVTCGMALAQRTIAPREYQTRRILLHTGERLPLATLLGRLQDLGYETTSVVELPGQASRRGGIVTCTRPPLYQPLRIEFLGDRVESLREFDLANQRTRVGA